MVRTAGMITVGCKQQIPPLHLLRARARRATRQWNALPAQFCAAKAFVDRLGTPVLAIPGNHDITLFDLWARLVRWKA